MTQKDTTGKELERRVANAYRQMGAWKVEHDVELAGNQIDVYVELETPGRLLHRIAVEAKDYTRPVGIRIVNDFAQIVKLLRGERLVDEGIIVSAAGFSRQARNAARTHGLRLLEPADLDAMVAEAKEAGRIRPTTPPIPPPPTPYFAHPYPLQENFTGRVRERRSLTGWLTGGGRPVLAVIALGGMGKSALTWAWLQRDVLGRSLPGLAQEPPKVTERCRVPEDERPEGALWWSFYEREAKFAAFLDEALAYASGGEIDLATLTSAHDKVRALVTLLQRRRLLLVLDGFERELRAYAALSAAYQGDAVTQDSRGDFRACTDPHAATFLRWAAAGPLQSRVLLTSRLFPRELDGLAGCRQEQLTALHREDAVTFFRRQGVRGTRAEIHAACAPYGYHPLALRLLAGVIVRDKRRPGDVRVTSRRSLLPQLRGKERHHILEVAYDALDRKKRALLSSISAFRSPMSYDALSTFNPYKSDEQFDAALDELMGRGLLLYQEETDRYDLHPIVRWYAYDRLADKAGVHTQLRDYFAAVPAPEEEQVGSVEDLAPVIELYHHTVRAGRYDEAFELFRDRLTSPLYFRFGAYQTCIELLRDLFPDGEDPSTGSGQATLPRLKEESAQAWTLNTLAVSYSLSGQSRRAVPLFEGYIAISEKRDSKVNVAIGLGNLAYQQIALGRLAPAEGNLRRKIEMNVNEFDVAVGHQELGRLLAYQGTFDEAGRYLTRAQDVFDPIGTNWISVIRAYRALRTLLMGDAEAALKAARRARELADVQQWQRDIIRAEWLLGVALVALSQRETGFLTDAETHLTEALARCRRISLVELEPEVLLAWARWHHANGNAGQARECAEEALAIADRCEYRLNQADCHNFLAQWHCDAGNLAEARQHAETAKERARCDGPPHCYQPALDEAERLLEEIPSP